MEKNQFDVLIDKNKIIDDGNGTITFKGGLVLTDESTQRNGTRYDISEMDLSQFDGTVFADHDYSVTAIVGKAIGIAKRAKRVIADGVKFAVKESSLARFVYEMVRSGFINAVSIGTMGELDDEGVYHNAEFLEFSFVGLGNNRSAKIQELALNTLKQSEKDGIETGQLRTFLSQNKVLVEDDNKDQVKKETNIMENETQTPVEEPKPEPTTPSTPQTPAPAAPASDQSAVLDAIKNIATSVKTLSEKVETMEKGNFDQNAIEPEFHPTKDKVTPSSNSALKSMGWQERTQMQVEKFYAFNKQGDTDAAKTLNEVNKFHKELLVKEGLAKNVMGMADFGNFVTSPELLTEIEGYRSDYTALLSVFNYRETNSLRLAWLNRSGDIDMQPVEMCDDDADGNLKPISDYEATPRTNDLEEMAAVTPVCTAATIFLAADLLGDAAAGYRNSYERNLARGVIAALELAAEDNDASSIVFDGGLTDQDDAMDGLDEVRQAIFSISQGEGILVMNEATMGLIWGMLLRAGAGNALTQQGLNGQLPNLWTKRFVVVPNDLMPTLGQSDYKTFTMNGSNVTINHAIFYVNPSNFTGRQNGGLRYDLSTEAAYEINGEVRSAYQRNEIVLRGSMFRGAVVRDNSRVGAVRALAVIS